MGQYKEKTCPQCNKVHRQRGPYCSKSCSNLARHPAVYEKVSRWMKESDKGQEISYNLKHDADKEDPILPPSNARPANSFIEGGDLWTVDNDW